MQIINATIQPAVSHLHRSAGVTIFTRIRRTFVESHNNISPYAALNFHRFLWGEEMIRTINVAFELHSFFLYFSGTGEGIYLISSTIGENISVPVHKLMQTSCLLQNSRSRAQVEVIGISKNNICINIFCKFSLLHSLNRSHRPYRHKDRSFYYSVVSSNTSSTGFGKSICF